MCRGVQGPKQAGVGYVQGTEGVGGCGGPSRWEWGMCSALRVSGVRGCEAQTPSLAQCGAP